MKKEIAIVGAGYTGLAAAATLLKKGYSVTVFEENQEPGGLAQTFKIEGAELEKLYHHVFKTDTDFLRLLESFGLENELLWQNSSISIYFNNHLYPFMTPVDLAKFKPLPFFDRIRAGLVTLYLQRVKNWEKLTHISAFEWMKKVSGKNVTRVIWEPLLRGKFGKSFDKVSMAWLWARISTRGNSREDAGAKEKLGYPKESFGKITEKIVEGLMKQGVKFEFGKKVTAVKNAESGVLLKFANQEKLFDGALLTVATEIAAELAEAEVEYKEKLKNIDYLASMCLVFSSDQDISPFYWNNINDTAFPFLVFVNHTKLIPKEKYAGKYIYYIGTYLSAESAEYKQSKEEVAKLWFKKLSEIFPEFDEKKVKESYLFKFPYSQHIAKVGYEKIIPEFETPLKNVYLANFSQIFPQDRGLNFAAKLGREAGEKISDEVIL